ncbi:MAG: saccharopine dehydrogenase NADP-binding domain-containing protein [Planctomycetes bacterium]|nr:saccharopine dehydrogenase NADP-binding domain-containing protein [Planctomycetota bacterium]
MASIIVLGSGMVGGAIALDLAGKHTIIATDFSPLALKKFDDVDGLHTLQLDVTDQKALRAAVSDVDLVVNAVPGFLGYEVLKTLIEEGKNVSDISFFPEEALDLHDLAVETGSVVVTDIGVAPGLSNLIFGHHDSSMTVKRFKCLVGGLPKHPKPPWFYKAPFSPVDVIEEYLRPARFVEDGVEVVRPALSEPELVDFETVGTLEAFNTDGLRSLLRTMKHVPDMVEKTLRYPGHRELALQLREGGISSEDVAEVLTQWKLEPNEEEFTVMRVSVSGQQDGQPAAYVWDLYDEFDPESGFSSMSRTTGFTCAAMAECILEGTWQVPGVSPGEIVGREELVFNKVLDYLRVRGVSAKSIKVN